MVTILMLVFAAIPALIALYNFWKNKQTPDPAILQNVYNCMSKLNDKLAGASHVNFSERVGLKQTRRRCEAIRRLLEEQPLPAVDMATSQVLFQCKQLEDHCERLKVPVATVDLDVSNLKTLLKIN